MHRIHLAEGLIDTFSGFFSKRVKAALSKLDELFFYLMEMVEPWLGNCFFGLCQALEGSTDDRSLPVTLELKETTFLPAPCFMVFHDLVPARPYLLQDGSYPEKPLESEVFQGSRYPKAIYKPVLYIRPSKEVGCLDSAPSNIFTISSSFSFFN